MINLLSIFSLEWLTVGFAGLVFVIYWVRRTIIRRKRTYQRYQKVMLPIAETWQQFAHQHDLTFTPSRVWHWDIDVKGRYQQRQLHITTLFEQSWTASFTAGDSIITHFDVSMPPLRLSHGLLAKSQVAQDMPKNILALLSPDIEFLYSKSESTVHFLDHHLRYRYIGQEVGLAHLARISNILCEIVENRAVILAFGTKALPALRDIIYTTKHPCQQPATLLLEKIAEISLGQKEVDTDFVCPDCLLYFETQSLNLPADTVIDYYACPQCQQNQNPFTGQIVALLDDQITNRQHETTEVLYINWLHRPRDFALDAVEIRQADDQTVARFMVYLKNAAAGGEIRPLKTMPCTLHHACPISENTRRILENTFGRLHVI